MSRFVAASAVPPLPTPRRAPLAAALLSLAASMACAQGTAPQSTIYTCQDANGRRLTSDRPIPDCMSREQRILNSDGSMKRVVPPSLTAEEKAEAEARELRAAAQRAAHQEAVRRDRNLMARYKDEAAHRRAREAALDDVRLATKTSETRLRALAAERKPLQEEAEFYRGKPVPSKLKQQLEANDVATQAQRELILNQQAEFRRIDAMFDLELARLKKLWAGASPGSLGPLQASEPAAASAPSTSPKR